MNYTTRIIRSTTDDLFDGHRFGLRGTERIALGVDYIPVDEYGRSALYTDSKQKNR